MAVCDALVCTCEAAATIAAQGDPGMAQQTGWELSQPAVISAAAIRPANKP